MRATHPALEAVLQNPAASRWMRDAIRSVLDSEQDPRAAASDGQLLAQLLAERARHASRDMSAPEAGGVDLLLPL